MRNLAVISSIVLFGFNAFGQSDTLNHVDDQGRKQGYWIIYGKDKPEKGFCDSCRIEEGPYVDDRKHGVWLKYHKDGETPRLKGDYINGRPDGRYFKYYENGQLKESGNFSRRKQRGATYIYYPSGCLAQEKYFNENGHEDGLVTYYFDDCNPEDSVCGTIEFQFDKKDGLIISPPPVTRGRFGFSMIHEEIAYGKDGNIVPKDTLNEIPDNGLPGVGGPEFTGGVRKDGEPLDPNGYNKLYNDNDELWMEGEFKNRRLWDGKLYKYDSDGILLKIEIWKNGKYHSDGDL